MKKLLIAVSLCLIASKSQAASTEPIKGDTFYVYQDGGSRANHFCPSGWMGSWGDLKFNQMWKEKPAAGKYSIQVKYSAERKQGEGWSGIYWQDPCNNWGNMKGGKNLHGFKKIKFMARGEKGKEFIDKFFFGGISGENSYDSDSAQTDAIELTKDWKPYEIDLTGLDMSSIVGGFGFVVNAESNPVGCTFYIDEIQYVK